MTFPSYNFTAVPYKGSLHSVPVGLATTMASVDSTGRIVRQPHQSKAVTTQYDWILNYPGNAVAVNLQSQGSAPPLDKLLMVYVDNTQCSFSLTLLFPDTQFTVAVPANSSGYYPVVTGVQYCTVYRNAHPTTDAVSQTTVLFCNFAVPAFDSPEFLNILGYQQISDIVGVGRQYVIPALGDKYANLTLQLVGSNSVGSQGNVLPIAALPQYYVITDIVMQLFQCSATQSQGTQQVELTLFDDSVGLTLREQFVFINPDCSQDSYKTQTILQENGLYLICQVLSLYGTITPGTVSIGLQTGFIQINVSYALISPTSP